MEEKEKKQAVQEELRVDGQQPTTEEELNQVAGGQFRGCDEKGVGYKPGRPVMIAVPDKNK